MQTVELVKLASQASAFAEEDLMLTHQQENVKILTNVWPQLDLFVVLTLFVKIFQGAMNVNVQMDLAATLSADVTSALKMASVAVNHLINSLEMNAD